MADLAGLLRPGSRVVDLGCGAGLPATRELTRHGLQVIGVDFSAVQIRRARTLVPGARLADMFWDHADTGTYLRWLEAARLEPLWQRYVPEGDSGHTLILARAS